MADKRIEKDSLGEVAVPAGALYGAQTARAVANFPISGWPMPAEFIRALGLVKLAAAMANKQAGRLAADQADAVIAAAQEVADGKLNEHFPVDVFQTGSGTSTNMNANEVIANRAIAILGGARGGKGIHPNDHVNMAQSSNDVIPTALHVAAAVEVNSALTPSLRRLREQLGVKASQFDAVVKVGRTHGMDAVPIRLGQEFGGYAAQIDGALGMLDRAVVGLYSLPIGGTAVGTGLNAPKDFAPEVCRILASRTGLPFEEAANHFQAQGAKDAVLFVSGALKTAAVAMGKVASDVRLLASGPRCGLGELVLPAVQPGSSIMPGKVNPVICESVVQVCCQVIGCDAAITAGATGGVGGILELNVAMPMIAVNLLTAIRLLGNAAGAFADKCIRGLKADEDRCRRLVEQSLAMATALAPRIGYDAAAEIAKQAFSSGRTVREVCIERKVLPRKELDELLDARGQTGT
ncbi:MAG TPA: class II fumarate hydratase [Phycisphaerae bacterium]|nr:class II fumarate hydratase [Phycisphaerae bacterium]